MSPVMQSAFRLFTLPQAVADRYPEAAETAQRAARPAERAIPVVFSEDSKQSPDPPSQVSAAAQKMPFATK
jgi:hypothetical protein